jgi:multicomponent Na+:H+ antiporter subunit D
MILTRCKVQIERYEMQQGLVILPILIPLLTGLTALIRSRELRRRAVTIGLLLNLIACVVLTADVILGKTMVSQMGGHPAPYGISLVIDHLSAIMLTITAIIGFAALIFSFATINVNRERFAYYPLMAFLIMGVNFAFLTGDLFSLYVAFEVMLMASFVLLTLGGERGQLEGGLKYVTLNLVSSTFFLIAVALTYAVAGTLNIAHLSERLSSVPSPGITTVLAVMFLVAFGIKAAMFPLFFWLPASYHTPPIAITALFGGLLTKVGVYALWRVLALIFPHDLAYLQPLILTVAGLTMVSGVLGAIAQTEFRRLLSFHIVSQIGYLLMGLGLFTTLSLTGAMFFMVHVIVSKTALFFISGITHEAQGTYQLKKLGGFQKSHPFLTVMFLLAALSLAGVPPLAGFWAKLILIRAGLEAGQYGITAVALAVSLLTLYSMVKIWNEVFWKPAKEESQAIAPNQMRTMIAPVIALITIIVAVGLLAEPMINLSERVAEELVSPTSYVQAVQLVPEVISP